VNYCASCGSFFFYCEIEVLPKLSYLLFDYKSRVLSSQNICVIKIFQPLFKQIVQSICLRLKTTMRKVFILSLSLLCLQGFSQNSNEKLTVSVAGSNQKQILKTVSFAELQTIINKKDNKLYVINFWATWCKPCVEELPEFMAVNKSYSQNPRFKMILVSLDLAREKESRVRPFLLKNKIEADVYILDDNKRMNEWIPTIDNTWSGAIPATVIYRNGEKLEFKENKLQKKELIQIINNHL